MDLSFEALIDSFVNKYKTPIKRAARGWTLRYQATCCDSMDQSHPLELAWKVCPVSNFGCKTFLDLYLAY